MIPRIKDTDEYYEQGYYICTADAYHNDTRKLKDENGKEIKLQMLNELNLNHRISHGNMATIVKTVGKTNFKVGDTIIVHHFALTGSDRKKKIHYEENGVEYYKISMRETFFKLGKDGKLTPREGVLLCKGVKYKPEQSKILDDRRDLVQVVDKWMGCKEFKPNDYLLLAKGADYQFENPITGESHIKVDVYFKDVWAIVDSPDWMLTEIREHIKDYNTKVTI